MWVNIGYRLSAFGFLACDEPKIDGNFGFKDQWLALEWIRDNIAVFGGVALRPFSKDLDINDFALGDPEDITITGLSAGMAAYI